MGVGFLKFQWRDKIVIPKELVRSSFAQIETREELLMSMQLVISLMLYMGDLIAGGCCARSFPRCKVLPFFGRFDMS